MLNSSQLLSNHDVLIHLHEEVHSCPEFSLLFLEVARELPRRELLLLYDVSSEL